MYRNEAKQLEKSTSEVLVHVATCVIMVITSIPYALS